VKGRQGSSVERQVDENDVGRGDSGSGVVATVDRYSGSARAAPVSDARYSKS
jgi:hypothetical protein